MTSMQHASADNQHFVEGVRLFNAGQFWHAHEQWEVCWMRAQEPEATFYKGIIQAAAALVHWQRGNLRGLRRNWYKARPKLVAMMQDVRHQEIGRFIAAMDRFVITDGSLQPPPHLRSAGAFVTL